MSETTTTTETVVEPTYTETEQKAMEHGWKPRSEFDETSGKRFVDADEFLDRQSFFDKINSLSREVKSLKSDLTTVSMHYSKVRENAYKQALVDLKERKAAALEADDHKAVVEIDDMIDDLKSRQQVQASTPPAEARELQETFVKWTEDNSWYNQDPDLHEFADAQGLLLRSKKPNLSYEELLQEVTKAVKKHHPEKFKTATPPQPSARTSTDAASTTRVTASKGLKRSDLTPEEMKVMDVFVRRGVLTEAEYLKQLAENR